MSCKVPADDASTQGRKRSCSSLLENKMKPALKLWGLFVHDPYRRDLLSMSFDCMMLNWEWGGFGWIWRHGGGGGGGGVGGREVSQRKERQQPGSLALMFYTKRHQHINQPMV